MSTEIIYAGEKDKDVLESYKEVIFSLLDKKIHQSKS